MCRMFIESLFILLELGRFAAAGLRNLLSNIYQMLNTSALSDAIEYRGSWISMKRESVQEIDIPKRE